MDHEQRFIRLIRSVQLCMIGMLMVLVVMAVFASKPELFVFSAEADTTKEGTDATISRDYWQPPDSTTIPLTTEGDLIRYGRELVSHTAVYLGPKGKVTQISNGMNCQNCHLKAGKKVFGNNYSAVASTYPRFRSRSGTVESVEKRVNDCIERSLNGKILELESREMKAFVAYILWVGNDVEKGVIPKGSGLWDLPLMDRAADPSLGKTVFEKHCVTCHGQNGLGEKAENGLEWKYPPLHGDGSYNVSAGLYRLSRLAGYVKANMPNGASFEKPILTDEEAWDVAAYINSLPRPEKRFAADWPDMATKPFDHPFGPYADTFSEMQHKYGPFAEIKKSAKK
jgi:thiosulfate dehydrogenase